MSAKSASGPPQGANFLPIQPLDPHRGADFCQFSPWTPTGVLTFANSAPGPHRCADFCQFSLWTPAGVLTLDRQCNPLDPHRLCMHGPPPSPPDPPQKVPVNTLESVFWTPDNDFECSSAESSDVGYDQ